MKTHISNTFKLFTFFVTFFSFGCNKYLEQKPITQETSNFVFKDVPTARQAIAGVYSQLVGDAAYGIRLSLYYTVDNDEMYISNGTGDRFDISWGSVSAASREIYDPWYNLFQGIEYANICINEIPKMTLYTSGTQREQAQLKRMYGEALTLRAQYYFEALRNWGDLPWHFQPASQVASSNPFPKRVDRNLIYDKILEDLKEAKVLVPWKSDLTSIGDAIDERITKGTVKGLRARIALYRGGFSLRQNGVISRNSDFAKYYQIARDECYEIIDNGEHKLNPSYKDLWKNQVGARAITDPHNELMFQASTNGTTLTDNSTKLGYYNGPRLLNSVGGTLSQNGGNGGMLILPTYFYKFDSNDTRRDVTIAPYGVSADDGITKIRVSSMLNIVDGKYRRDWVSNPSLVVGPTAGQYFGLKWQILRYSDILLMFAEAENELNGPTVLAYNAINQVRRRGFGKSINSPDISVDVQNGLGKDQFFDAIVRERTLELGAEGIRKHDLIRWNLYKTKIDETKNWLDQLASTGPTMPAGISSYTGITLPRQMFFITGTKADDQSIFANSFYQPSGSAPAGTTAMRWFNLTSGTYDVLTIKSRIAKNFLTGRSELLPIPQVARTENPNLTQNPNY
jgi:hypothetical protein